MGDDSCVVVADNVLKPGTPLYLWYVCHLENYRTDIVSLREFGRELGHAQVEDWMAISRLQSSEKRLGGVQSFSGLAMTRDSTLAPATPPSEIVDLASDTDHVRWRTL